MALRPRGADTSSQSFIAVEGQTTFKLTKGIYKPLMDDIEVYIEGVKQITSVNFIEYDPSTVVLKEVLPEGTPVEIVWEQVPRVPGDEHVSTHARGGSDELKAGDILNSVQVVNVKDFGAIGNGVADDTTPMQMAISYAKFFQADEVYFPTGKYNVGIVTNFTNVTLVGTGVQFVGTHQYEIHNIDTLEKKAQDIYVKLNDISIYQINKNYGKFDQSFMSDEFLQQIVGTAALHSIPADGSITTAKLADKAVTSAKLGDASVNAAHLTNGSVTVEKLAPDVLNSMVTRLPVLKTDPVNPQIGQMWIIVP